MLPLQFNLLAMLVGLLLVNWLDSMAGIMFKQEGKASKMAGYVCIMLMEALSLYLMVTNMMELLQLAHEIWLYTFIFVYFLEVVVLELVMITMKIYIQPCLQKYYESENQFFRMFFVTFWDIKVQRIMRRLHREAQKKQKAGG